MDIAILLFDRFTALDAVGPYEVLSRLPDANRHVRRHRGRSQAHRHRAARARRRRHPRRAPAPGHPPRARRAGQAQAEKDEAILDWLRTAHETTTWTTSVCTGSLVLGAAGLLEGKRATTYWLALEDLARHGAIPTNERVVIDGKVVTAAGVSSGIDMALTLAARDRRRRPGPADPARHRVRPAAALRLRAPRPRPPPTSRSSSATTAASCSRAESSPSWRVVVLEHLEALADVVVEHLVGPVAVGPVELDRGDDRDGQHEGDHPEGDERGDVVPLGDDHLEADEGEDHGQARSAGSRTCPAGRRAGSRALAGRGSRRRSS